MRKLQLTDDTRKVFTSRASLRTAVDSMTTNTVGSASTTMSVVSERTGPGQVTTTGTGTSAHSATSVSNSTLTDTFEETGFFVFSGLPPQFLHIIFTDGKVTGRKTEFLK